MYLLFLLIQFEAIDHLIKGIEKYLPIERQENNWFELKLSLKLNIL